jgi:hypothetical protein
MLLCLDYRELSVDLQKHYGSDSGYSPRNPGYMKSFAAEYPDFSFLQVPLAPCSAIPLQILQKRNIRYDTFQVKTIKN